METKQINLDILHINSLKLKVLIGINPKERRKKQPLLLNVALYVAPFYSKDSRSPDLCYATVMHKIIELTSNSNFFLLESFANFLAEKLLKMFPIEKIKIVIEKPKALLPFAKSAALEIVREK